MNADNNISWEPPEFPDLQEILQEARTDSNAGRYALALEKFLWFHHHALDYDEAYYGVRLSFALGYWHDLATKFSPAMDALHEVRDQAKQKLIEGIDSYHSFNEESAISKRLGEQISTRDLFLQIHNTNETLARKIYHLAQPVLIEFALFDICDHYLDATEAINKEIEQHQLLVKLYQNNPSYYKTNMPNDDGLDFVPLIHLEGCATIVALLIKLNRRNEATEIAWRIKYEGHNLKVDKIVDQALKGEFPSRHIH